MLLFDMGLPMIIPTGFLMVVTLVPIVFIEAHIVGTALQLDFKKVLAPVTIANLVSTLIGIPVTWFLLALLEIGSVIILGTIEKRIVSADLFALTLGAPWVYPGHDNENLIILGAMLFLLIPYGLASWAIEYYVVKIILAKKQSVRSSPDQIKFAVSKANLISYCILAILAILLPIFFGSN